MGRKAAAAIQAAAFVILVLCMAKLVPKWMEYQESRRAFEQIEEEVVTPLLDAETEPEPEEETDAGEMETEALPDDLDQAIHIDWDALAGTDTVAWLQLDGISYPVLQAEDNETYLHHLPDGTYNYGGSLFLYNANDAAFTDESSFIYGHNMADGSMFGRLRDYTDSSYADHKFYLYLPDGDRLTYRFYSIVSASQDDSAYTWSFSSEASFLSWQEQMKGRSLYGNTPSPSGDAKYLTLSTCNGYAGTSQRLLLTGQLEARYHLQEPASWYKDP